MRVLLERDLAARAEGEGAIATRALRASLDAVVVVGAGPTGGLKKRPVPVIHVRRAAELVPEWFWSCATVALFPGPFCTPQTLDAARRTLEAMP